MKISYLCIVVCSICFFACSSDEYSEEDFFWTANPVLLRGEAEIKVLITNPSVIIDYFKEPLDPDYFMVLYSEEAVSFKDSVRVDIGESDITLTGLTNDTPYYVKVKTYKKGFKMIESFVTMSTPGSSLSIEDLDLGVTSDVDRFSYSSDGRYFLYQGGRHDKLHFIEVGALGQVTTLNLDAYLGRWAQDNNEFVFTVNETLDNRVYNRYFMQYDIEAASLDTVLNLDQSTWSFYNPQ